MCYAVPTAGAIVTSFMLSKNKSPELGKLNLLLWGGAMFGVIDHLWNRELFLISPDIANDLFLGITLSITAVWAILVFSARYSRRVILK